jgi:hypothetical protein
LWRFRGRNDKCQGESKRSDLTFLKETIFNMLDCIYKSWSH